MEGKSERGRRKECRRIENIKDKHRQVTEKRNKETSALVSELRLYRIVLS